jgi:hypothetical protein
MKLCWSERRSQRGGAPAGKPTPVFHPLSQLIELRIDMRWTVSVAYFKLLFQNFLQRVNKFIKQLRITGFMADIRK